MPPTCSAGRQDHRRDHRLLDLGDSAGVGQLRRAVNLFHLTVGRRHAVEHARRRRHQVDVEFALEPLLDDLQVKQAEKSTAKSEAECDRALRLVEKRRVVQPQLFERITQLRVLVALDGIQPGEHHRLQFFEAGKRRHRLARRFGDGVADLGVADLLDVGDQEADFPDPELVNRHRLRREDAQLLDVVVLPLRHEPDAHAFGDVAVNHANHDDDAAIGVVPRVEQQRLERRLGIAGGRRQPRHDGFENLRHPGAHLRARQNRSRPVESDDVLDLSAGLLGLGARQIDLVDDRDDLQAVVHRKIGVGERLRLDALRRVNQQERAFAGGERSRDFVGEVDVTRCVDEIEDVFLTGLRAVVQADGMGLDRDAALALEVHRVEHLRLHLAGLESAGNLEKTIGQRRLAMVDVRDDGKVTDVAQVHSAG